MQIEWRSLSDVTPYPGNPRKNDRAVDAVAASLQQFGFRQPIVVDANGVIVCGHVRYKAAVKLGLDRIPVHVARDLTAEQIRAYRLADNQTADLAFWDYELLPIELRELRDADYDIGSLGFSENALSALLEPITRDGLTEADAVPELPDEAITKPGDLWILGDHRLLCGDSSKLEDVDRLLAGATIHLVNTDPPYNLKVAPRSNNAIAACSDSSLRNHNQRLAVARNYRCERRTHRKLRAKDRPLANDFVSEEAFDLWVDAWIGNFAGALAPGRSFYVWGGYNNFNNYPRLFQKHKLHLADVLVWDKQRPVLDRKDFLQVYEIAFYGWRRGAPHVFVGPHNVENVWRVPKMPAQKTVHLTEKPVELALRAIQYSSREGECVLDLFGGSGSTLIAAEQAGRRAFLMEIDPLYCDVIVQRWEQFTGRHAEREGKGH